MRINLDGVLVGERKAFDREVRKEIAKLAKRSQNQDNSKARWYGPDKNIVKPPDTDFPLSDSFCGV
jgi:hypothetical protein